ncbi:MAG: restriction endonuclease subunit S [archaeon]
MNSGWKECKLGNLISLEYGKSLDGYRESFGKYPVYGTNGKIGNADSFLSPIPSIIIGRKGAYRGVHYSKLPFYVIDTAFYVKPKTENIDLLYLYNFLLTLDINAKDSGSAIPSTDRYEIYDIDIMLPSRAEQRAIAGVLSSLDDKIDLLHRQNKTLEGMAEALWRKMFVEEANPGLKKGKLGDYLKVQGGYAFKSSDFKESGEIGIIKITNISAGLVDIINTQFVNRKIIETLDHKFKIATGSILIAMTGAEIGKIGIVEKTEKEIWLNQRVGMFCEIRKYGNLLGFFALNSEEGQEHILSSATGSAQPNISSTGIEDFEMTVVPDSILNIFGIAAQLFFDKICFNLGQIRTLSHIRDTLLPKLMGGEVRIAPFGSVQGGADANIPEIDRLPGGTGITREKRIKNDL